MLLQKRQRGDGAALPRDDHGLARRQTVVGGDRRILAAGRRLEAIAEPVVHGTGSALVEVKVDGPALLDVERAQVIDTVGMIGVLVGIKHRIKPIDLGIQKLLAQIG